MRIVALIPSRSGSLRCQGKNMRLLGGSPLIAYTMAAAVESDVFESVLVCSDDAAVLALAVQCRLAGYLRPLVTADQPDIQWVRQAIASLDVRPDAFAILRATSPFRTADTIRRAYREFTVPDGTHDSLRAVRPVRETPYKMWTCDGPGYPIKPLLNGARSDGTPYHSSPTQSCPPVWMQTSSLEMAYTTNVEVYGNIHGRKVIGFICDDETGFSIDTEADFAEAERLVATGAAQLPPVSLAALSTSTP